MVWDIVTMMEKISPVRSPSLTDNLKTDIKINSLLQWSVNRFMAIDTIFRRPRCCIIFICFVISYWRSFNNWLFNAMVAFEPIYNYNTCIFTYTNITNYRKVRFLITPDQISDGSHDRSVARTTHWDFRKSRKSTFVHVFFVVKSTRRAVVVSYVNILNCLGVIFGLIIGNHFKFICYKKLGNNWTELETS